VVSYNEGGTQIKGQNRLLRRIFGANRHEVTVGWRTFPDEEFHNVNFSPDILRIIKSNEAVIGQACNMHGGDEKCVKYFGWKA
jgi:hypothetical protein